MYEHDKVYYKSNQIAIKSLLKLQTFTYSITYKLDLGAFFKQSTFLICPLFFKHPVLILV